MKNLACMVAIASIVSAGAVASSIPSDVIVRGWKPQVDLIGSGDPSAAVSNLRDIAELQRRLSRPGFEPGPGGEKQNQRKKN